MPRDRAQKSRAVMEELMAACRLRPVFCHETGSSIHPRGLSMAMTDRSSYKIGIGSQSGSSMQSGLDTKVFLFLCAILSQQVRDVFSFLDFTTSVPNFCKRQRCHAFIIFCINVSTVFQQPFNGLKCSLLSREM